MSRESDLREQRVKELQAFVQSGAAGRGDPYPTPSAEFKDAFDRACDKVACSEAEPCAHCLIRRLDK